MPVEKAVRAKLGTAENINNPNKPKKPFRLFDAVLATVCVILVVEAAAPSAAIGNSKYFWWVVSLIGFFVPYGLVTAELGTTYVGKGGLYDWITRAFGRRWGSRAAWYYWMQFAMWVAALAVLFTEVVTQTFRLSFSTPIAIAIQLAFIWGVAGLSLMSISESKILINICSYFKVALMAALGVLGLYYGLTHGVANPVESGRDLLPGVMGLSFIAVVIFNFTGFEVVTTFASDMKQPQKEIPKALLMAGGLIVAFYLFASFGISAAIPRSELSTYGGLLDSFYFFFAHLNIPSIFIIVVAVMFLYSLVTNPVVWALGVNNVASHAAENGAMPAIFARKTAGGAPVGATVMSSLVATVMVLAAPFIPNPDIFWGFFALQVMMLLLPYALMFPAFKKLRRLDAATPRPFRVPGGPVLVNLITYVPTAMLVFAGVLVAVYPNGDGTWTFEWLMIIGSIAAVILGEIIVRRLRLERGPSSGAGLGSGVPMPDAEAPSSSVTEPHKPLQMARAA